MSAILHISPFPDAKNAASGGQIRISETRNAYTALGHTVLPCHFVTRSRDLHNPFDIKTKWIDRVYRKHIGHPKNIGQLRLYWATKRSSCYANALANSIKTEIQAIHLEHPWLIPFATEIKKSPHIKNAKVIYSAHNIEADLHHQLWNKTKAKKKIIENLLQDVSQAEAEAIRASDICWAVSQAEKEKLIQLGAKRVLLVPNGCRDIYTPVQSEVSPNQKPYVLFVGGSYQPNVDGFLEWAGDAAEQIPDGTTVIIAGAAGAALRRHPKLSAFFDTGRILDAGIVSTAHLDSLITCAHAILLPISKGAGTNLKTSEALCSGRPIIATPYSFRGFEEWLQAEGVSIADSPKRFSELVCSALNITFQEKQYRPNMEQIRWNNILRNAITETVAALDIPGAGS